MKVAIIDSGVEASIFPEINIEQYRIYDKKVIQEYPIDYVEHGTSMLYIILNETDISNIISICPGIDHNGKVDEYICSEDMETAIRLAVDKGADIINISMGTTDFSKRYLIDDACKYAYDKGALIVCGTSSDGVPSMPWGCENIIKVWNSEGIGNEVCMQEVRGVLQIVVKKNFFHTKNSQNKRFIIKNNSPATAWVTNKLIKATSGKYNQNILEQYVERNWGFGRTINELYNQKISIIKNESMNQKINLKNVCLLPFNKEMHGIVRFENICDYNVKAIVDSPKKGLVGKNVGDLIQIENVDIIIQSDLKYVNQHIDTIILGYLDEIEKYDKTFSIDNILSENLKTLKANIYSFVPVSTYWITKYRKEGLDIKYAPFIGIEKFNEICNNIPYNIPISKPVLGVFGTSSSQGKFTLQIYIKEYMKRRNIKCTHVSTEHHGEVLGADVVFPFGYEVKSNIDLPMEMQKVYIEKLMIYASFAFEGEFILVGGQSGIIPYSINYEGFLHNAVLLEGVKPDASILVFNPYMDDEEYVKDCMSALKAIYKCKTICMAFSDNTYKNINGRWKKRHLEESEKKDIIDKSQRKYGVPCGCITDCDFIDVICKNIIDFFS